MIQIYKKNKKQSDWLIRYNVSVIMLEIGLIKFLELTDTILFLVCFVEI